ncbi:MFS transporter [Pseudemcibacter aquimaris]|uniref:MFS transporter n=1 Tax=Pseudemcibacter aquimaris TaxID=2857064 RepID=UPI00201173BD|nr:MFS transporter [Pseudemcibacter aquimaris]MCC3861042.1 MFS transporter [Pseudemcibacter aquimaris]WDU59859.1 MFS transporter [Pseudemcibacter aquimaris]
MSNNVDAGAAKSNPFDRWSCLLAAVAIALIGYNVTVSVPVLSTALVAKAGFSEVEVGRIWGADMGGLAIGAVLSAFFVSRINRWHIIYSALVLYLGANILCMVLGTYQEILILRLFSGIASGLFCGVAAATLSGATNPVFAFNLELFGFAFSTAAALHFLPQLSMNGIYIVFIILGVLIAGLVLFIPKHPLNEKELNDLEMATEKAVNWKVPKILPVMCLSAICLYYINIGGYYTYIELAALSDGLAQSFITPVLTWSSIFAIIGCVLAHFANRYGLFKPLYFGLLAMAASAIMLYAGISETTLVISLFAFMTLWTFIDIYQAAMIAHMDRSGMLAALVPAVIGFGQFLGPNVAASMLEFGMGYHMMFVVCGSMAMGAFLIYLFVGLNIRKHLNVAVAE